MTNKILETSFGYDMTINDYYKVISENAKTALVQPIGRTVANDHGLGNGQSMPDVTKEKGKPFRAFKRAFMDRTIYVSKYFGGHSADVWSGTPSYFNTWD